MTETPPGTSSEESARNESPDLATTARWLESKYGFVSNLAQTLAHSPGVLLPWLSLEDYCRHDADVTERQRMIIILVAVRDVNYCWAHYKPMAAFTGLTEDQIDWIRRGRVPRDLSDVEQIICQVANEIVASRRIPEIMYDDIVKSMPPRKIVDITILASFYLAMSALSTGLCLEVEAPEILRREQALFKTSIGQE